MSDCKECKGNCGCNEPEVKEETKTEQEDLVAAKSNGPLVEGHRNKKVIYPLSVLQNRIDAMENMINHNFNSIQQNRFHDFKYFHESILKVNAQLDDVKVMLQTQLELSGIKPDAFYEAFNAKKKEIEKAKADAEDVKNNRKAVDREATVNDIVHFDFVGKIDGVPFDGGSGKNQHLDLTNSEFIPGFAEQLVGVKAGDVKDVVVKFPENYGRPNLNGKEAVFTCTVTTVKEKVVPESK